MAEQPNRDELHSLIVDALEAAAFRNEWEYPPETTALEAAIAVADIVVAALDTERDV